MTGAGSPTGHLLLVGDPGATLDIAAGMLRSPQSALSVHNASPAALERLHRAAGRPLVMVDVPIDLDDLLARLNADRALAADGPVEFDRLVGRTVAEVERALILHTLARCHGNRTSASIILGISVRTMRNKLRMFIEDGISVAPAA
jgi:hypothetical protein